MTKAKILCLHGYGTNAKFMKKQASTFIKTVSRDAQLIFVDGPFAAPQNFVMDQKVIDLIEGQHRSWFPNIPTAYFKELFMIQFDKIRVVFEQASDHYDGILGFSQGALLLHFIIKCKQEGIIKWKILDNIKFSFNLNGNHYKYSLFENWQKQIQLPSFHMISSDDFLFSNSLIHTTQFKNPEILSHTYGHKFPKLGIPETKMILQFIRKHYKSANSKKNFQVLQLSNL